jgi:hypothetical protein
MMACSRFNGLMGAVIAGSMFVSSTGAVAATAPAQNVSPWAVMTLLSGGAPAAALCGAAAVAAAAQPAPTGCVLPALDAPPPVAAAPPGPVPPPLEAPAAGFGFNPLLLGLLALAIGVGFFFLVKNNNHHRQGNSAT